MNKPSASSVCVLARCLVGLVAGCTHTSVMPSEPPGALEHDAGAPSIVEAGRHAQATPAADAGQASLAAFGGGSPAPAASADAGPLSHAGNTAQAGQAGHAAPAASAGTTLAANGGAPAQSTTAPAAIDCTRAGLHALVEAYFHALTAHDPTRLPVAASVKVTENAQPIKLGEGIWPSAGNIVFQRSALDTEHCGTFTEAAIDDQIPSIPDLNTLRGPAILGVRLKLEAQQLTEIETYVVLNAGMPGPFSDDLIKSAIDPWETPLPLDRRSTRPQLEAAAEAYFEAYSNPASRPPVDPTCKRLDNGKQADPCGSNMGLGSMHLPVAERRYPVTDLDAGIVLGLGLHEVAIPGFVMLKLDAGTIHFIDAGVAFVSRGSTTSGW